VHAATVSNAPASQTESRAVGASTTGTTGALPQLNSFLSCVVQAESGGDYQAISPTGQYMGAFQFAQPTWNEAAQLAGIPSLAGVAPYTASPRDQDLLAIALYDADGEQPWYDPCNTTG
ncbi:MAG TPA: transglycosylase family protein, partial [Acidimicrobiales bacterium]|nr:transglycosylase family protein [Acidimicrobiales bacterium]